MPTLVQLEYALSVEKHRHFGKASKAVHVSQPTLSQQLRKLEDEVGLVLFDRGKKPILPTPEGEQFLAQARVVLREQKKLLEIPRQSLAQGLSGDFRLGVIPTVATDLLPLLLRPFSQQHPKVRLLLEELKTETILEELGADRLDGAILATPLEGSDFKVHPLYYEPFFLYFASGHPLLKKTKVAREDLDFTEMWLLQDGHCFKDQVLNFCARPGKAEALQANARFRSGSLDTLRRLVRAGSGYTLIPALMVLSLRKEERDAHVRPFSAPVPTREISMVYRRDHWKLPQIRAIESTVRACLPEGIPRESEKTQKILAIT
jgi:LysR family hydrogen peroxide-inducible transcriptional activator